MLIVTLEGGSRLKLVTVEVPKERSGVAGRIRVEGDDLRDLEVETIVRVSEPSTEVSKVEKGFR